MSSIHPTAYGTGDVTVKLKDRVREQHAASITLPEPSIRKLTYKRETVTLTYYKDRRVEEALIGFRPVLFLEWQKYATQTDLDNVLKVARWSDLLDVIPFDDVPIGFEMQVSRDGVDIEPQANKLEVPQIIQLQLVGTIPLPTIKLIDELWYAALGAPAVQAATNMCHLLFRAVVLH